MQGLTTNSAAPIGASDRQQTTGTQRSVALPQHPHDAFSPHLHALPMQQPLAQSHSPRPTTQYSGRSLPTASSWTEPSRTPHAVLAPSPYMHNPWLAEAAEGPQQTPMSPTDVGMPHELMPARAAPAENLPSASAGFPSSRHAHPLAIGLGQAEMPSEAFSTSPSDARATDNTPAWEASASRWEHHTPALLSAEPSRQALDEMPRYVVPVAPPQHAGAVSGLGARAAGVVADEQRQAGSALRPAGAGGAPTCFRLPRRPAHAMLPSVIDAPPCAPCASCRLRRIGCDVQTGTQARALASAHETARAHETAPACVALPLR